jgi:prevent-host-death family protein
MTMANIRVAKAHFSRLVEEAAAGSEIIIAKAGKPVARLVPLETATERRRIGTLKGVARVPPEFDLALPGPVLGAFEGR